MTLDERDQDDAAAEVNGITYIAETALLTTVGRSFSITLDEKGLFRVAAPESGGACGDTRFSVRPRS